MEVIGGAEKYMATCRRCYTTNVRIPSSPRPLENVTSNKENSSELSNGLKRKLESDHLAEPNEKRDIITKDCPSIKALFSQE